MVEKLNSVWCFWYHLDLTCWTANSFKLLAKIETVEDFWQMVETLQNNQIIIEHIYFMRDGIMPMWEDDHNRNGGCWSLKVDIKDSYLTLVKILIYLIGENILYKDGKNISDEMTGISLCQKNNYNCVLQLWTSNSKNNKINYLKKEITDAHGYEVIFKSHIAEF